MNGGIKSQFVSGATNTEAGKYLLGSLSLIGEDTRGGLSQNAQATIKGMNDYVAANPDKTNPEKFQSYVAKLSSTATEMKPAQSRTVKPTTGMMS